MIFDTIDLTCPECNTIFNNNNNRKDSSQPRDRIKNCPYCKLMYMKKYRAGRMINHSMTVSWIKNDHIIHVIKYSMIRHKW